MSWLFCGRDEAGARTSAIQAGGPHDRRASTLPGEEEDTVVPHGLAVRLAGHEIARDGRVHFVIECACKCPSKVLRQDEVARLPGGEQPDPTVLEWVVRREYHEFAAMHADMVDMGCTTLPDLPRRHFLRGRDNEAVIAERRMQLPSVLDAALAVSRPHQGRRSQLVLPLLRFLNCAAELRAEMRARQAALPDVTVRVRLSVQQYVWEAVVDQDETMVKAKPNERIDDSIVRAWPEFSGSGWVARVTRPYESGMTDQEHEIDTGATWEEAEIKDGDLLLVRMSKTLPNGGLYQYAEGPGHLSWLATEGTMSDAKQVDASTFMTGYRDMSPRIVGSRVNMYDTHERVNMHRNPLRRCSDEVVEFETPRHSPNASWAGDLPHVPVS